MASSPSPSTAPTSSHSRAPDGAHRGRLTGILSRLDLLLSEELRRGTPFEMVRNRVLAGGSALLLVFALVGLPAFPSLTLRIVMGLIALSYAFALWMLRRASSHLRPAAVVCTASIVGGSTLFFILNEHVPYFGTHAGLVLQPLLAVYLLGARRGFPVAVIWACVSLLFPLYYTQWGTGARSPPDEFLWPLFLCASFTFVAAWGLSALHSSALHEAQGTLEHTLEELRAREGQLVSVFESTDDLVFSLDLQGNLLTCNASAKQVYLAQYGQEPMVGQPFFPTSVPELLEAWKPRLSQALTGQRQRYEEAYDVGGSRQTFDVNVSPIGGAEGRITGVTVFARNITAARREAELRLGELYNTLVDVSRQAGMAEVATGVLHNVGNTLNSVNVSATLVIDQLLQTRLPGLAKVSALLQERSHELGPFFTQNPRGQLLPNYIAALSEQLHQEHGALLKEVRALSASVEHIKSVIRTQQKHARVAGAVEEVSLPQLIDEALRLHAVSFERLGIRIERDYSGHTPLLADRHRLLQILVNLLSNARDALTASETRDKSLRLTIRRRPGEERLLLQVTDNGVGIAPENVQRMFSQGFTTKKEGHGFGLHISAMAATEMGGQLTCSSPGPGQGATFTLELPRVPPK